MILPDDMISSKIAFDYSILPVEGLKSECRNRDDQFWTLQLSSKHLGHNILIQVDETQLENYP